MVGRKFKLEISGWWEQKDENYCFAWEEKAMKYSNSLDTKKAFSILTFTVLVYLHCPLLLGQTMLRTHGNLNCKW